MHRNDRDQCMSFYKRSKLKWPRATPSELEMAYQARTAIDRSRFAIKYTKQFGPQTDQMRETVVQLLDALQGIETARLRRCAIAEAGQADFLTTLWCTGILKRRSAK
jgi:hypothetical protein